MALTGLRGELEVQEAAVVRRLLSKPIFSVCSTDTESTPKNQGRNLPVPRHSGRMADALSGPLHEAFHQRFGKGPLKSSGSVPISCGGWWLLVPAHRRIGR
jgi:hypothetical protein